MLCAATVILNLTLTWTSFDQETLVRARARCGQIYPDAPCLKKFTKKTDLAYLAACGPKTIREKKPL